MLDDITSEFEPKYNCIAYAAKKTSERWWPYLPTMPQARYFVWPVNPEWPPNVPNFFKAFETCGFKPCKNGKHQFGYEKVAIYVDVNGGPKHMARELGDGVWYSKLGSSQDIRHHTLEALEQSQAGYGNARHFMRKRIREISRWRILIMYLRRFFE